MEGGAKKDYSLVKAAQGGSASCDHCSDCVEGACLTEFCVCHLFVCLFVCFSCSEAPSAEEGQQDAPGPGPAPAAGGAEVRGQRGHPLHAATSPEIIPHQCDSRGGWLSRWVWSCGCGPCRLPLAWQDLNTLWRTMDVDAVGHVDELCILPCLVGEMSERRKDCVRKVCAHAHPHPQMQACKHAVLGADATSWHPH